MVIPPFVYYSSIKVGGHGSSMSVFTLDQDSRISYFDYCASSDYRTPIKINGVPSFSRSGCIKTCPLLSISGTSSQLEGILLGGLWIMPPCAHSF